MSLDLRPFVEKANDAYAPEAAPDWVLELAKLADLKGLEGAGKAIGRSGGLVSQVVNRKYGQKGGDLRDVEERVRGALMSATVWCQGFGTEISRKDCLDWQGKPRELCTTSGFARRMFRACRDNCPNYRAAGKPTQSTGGNDVEG